MYSGFNKEEAAKSLENELELLLQTAKGEQVEKWRRDFDTYKDLFHQFLYTDPIVSWEKVHLPPPGTVRQYEQLPDPNATETKSLLEKLVVVKLNGGLGTGMGCRGPKSLITVRDGMTFLDFSIMQIENLKRKFGVNIPLVLMNSFNTEAETERALKKYRANGVDVHMLLQSRCPRIDKETLLPIASNLTDQQPDAWYPPGHGDFFRSVYNSEMLAKFFSQGKEFFFLSNIDNTGATVDLRILNLLASEQFDYLMEVTEKTPADVKGGTVIEYEGRLMHLEIPQVPPENLEEFKGINRFSIFNTNNVWVSLKSINALQQTNKMEMEVIVNPKVTPQGVTVLQLENGIGSAIRSFDKRICVNVSRGRFLPVKKTQDLLLIMSNFYEIQGGRLIASKGRTYRTMPLIKLGRSFDKVGEFLSRFEGIPDMLSLNHLTVAGDVWFGKSICLKGTVIIIADSGQRIHIADGTCLENKIVTGNLRILEH